MQTTPASSLRLLTAHHPFWLPPLFAHRELVRRRDAALQAFHAEVDIILSGHVHLTYAQVTQWVIMSHAGTTLSNRLLLHHTNSFNVIRGDRERLSLELMEWGSQRFRLSRQEVAAGRWVDATALAGAKKAQNVSVHVGFDGIPIPMNFFLHG